VLLSYTDVGAALHLQRRTRMDRHCFLPSSITQHLAGQVLRSVATEISGLTRDRAAD